MSMNYKKYIRVDNQWEELAKDYTAGNGIAIDDDEISSAIIIMATPEVDVLQDTAFGCTGTLDNVSISPNMAYEEVAEAFAAGRTIVMRFRDVDWNDVQIVGAEYTTTGVYGVLYLSSASADKGMANTFAASGEWTFAFSEDLGCEFMQYHLALSDSRKHSVIDSWTSAPSNVATSSGTRTLTFGSKSEAIAEHDWSQDSPGFPTPDINIVVTAPVIASSATPISTVRIVFYRNSAGAPAVYMKTCTLYRRADNGSYVVPDLSIYSVGDVIQTSWVPAANGYVIVNPKLTAGTGISISEGVISCTFADGDNTSY